MAPLPILFSVDEDLPRHKITLLLTSYGYQVYNPERGEKDPAVIASAEASGAVIITADHHIYNALRRKHPYDRGLYRRAGVVIIPQYEEGVTEALLNRWIHMIEGVWLATRDGDDQRVVIDLRGKHIYIDQ
jgi:hypothetical protein